MKTPEPSLPRQTAGVTPFPGYPPRACCPRRSGPRVKLTSPGRRSKTCEDGSLGQPGGRSLVGRQWQPGGRSYRLTLKSDGEGVRLDRARFQMPWSEADQGAVAMRRWYPEDGGKWLRKRIRPSAARIGEPSDELEARDLAFRWGSARPTHSGPPRINIHWAALQLPPSLIDYVLVHELAHLRESNHTPDFWSIVARLMPNFETPKTTLAAIGKHIWLGTGAA